MAAAVLTPIDLDRHQKVRAWVDLPAVPVGTPGKVLQVTGVSWIRYRVLFDNGVEHGLLDGRHIIARDDYIAPEDRVAEEAVDERVAAADGEVAGAAEADNEFGVPAHLLERSQAARRGDPRRDNLNATTTADTHQGRETMQLSTQLSYAGGFKQAVDHVVDLERAGLDMVWVAEAYSFDAVSSMGYLAARTETVQIASGILPIYSRTPTLIAMTAAGLDALSNGRCILGLGASGPQVIEGFHGVAYDKPLGRTREIIDICRQVWRRERVEHDGASYQIPLPVEQGTGLGKPLKLINHPVRAEIPIYVASLGPKNVEMTAEKADGWLPLFYLPEKAKHVWGADLAAGAAKRDEALGPLEIVAGGLLSVGDDAQAIRELSRPMIALYVGGMGAKGRNFYNDLVKRYGYEAEAEAIQDLYLDGKKDEAAALVPDELLEATSLCGSEGYVRERLAAYQESGVTVLNITPVGPDPVKVIEQVKGWIEDL